MEFIDVTGIQVLQDAASHARKAGGDLSLRSPPVPRRTLDLLHLESAMSVELQKGGIHQVELAG